MALLMARLIRSLLAEQVFPAVLCPRRATLDPCIQTDSNICLP